MPNLSLGIDMKKNDINNENQPYFVYKLSNFPTQMIKLFKKKGSTMQYITVLHVCG